MKKIDCCYKCTEERHIGCHANCKKYILQKAEYDREQEEIRNRKLDSYCPTAFRPLRERKLYNASRGF